MNTILAYIEKNPNKSFALALLLMFCYQSINIFFGFEPLDSGFYLVNYANIIDSPDTVARSLGGNYFTNIAGGFMLRCFPSMGIVEFRMMGALTVLCTLTIVYAGLKKFIPVVHILLASVLVILTFSSQMEKWLFSNGLFSCCLYAIAIIFIFRGLIERKSWLLIVGGIVIGINIFSRLPNILGIGLGGIVLLSPLIFGQKKNLDWNATFRFLFGVLLGFLIVLLIIISLGHEQYMVGSVNSLSNSAVSSNSTHSILTLIIAQIYSYHTGIIAACIFFTIFYLDNIFRESAKLNVVFKFAAMLFLFYYVYLMQYPCDMLWAFGFSATVIVPIRRKWNESIVLLTLFGLYMMIVERLGSNSGYAHASLPEMIIAPVASMVIVNRRNVFFLIVATATLAVKAVRQGPFDEFGSLREKTAVVNHPQAHHIYTLPSKAAMYNEILRDINLYVKERDTLLVWDTAPMLNFLTHTYPLGAACPLYSSGVLPTLQRQGVCPKILFLKDINSRHTQIPEEGDSKTLSLGKFIRENGYVKVTENRYMILYASEHTH